MASNYSNSGVPSEVPGSDGSGSALARRTWDAMVPYLPNVLLDAVSRNPDRPAPWIDSLDGSLVLADISGFTPLSERLSQAGKEGAEWLTDIINKYFHTMLDIARQYGGSNVKFGGDALLLFFGGDNHVDRAVATALAMQRATRKLTSFRVGQYRVRLGMTVGVHSGSFWSAAAGLPGRRMQHFILGWEAARVAEVQSAAGPGELFITENTLKLIGGTCVAESSGSDYRVIRLSKRIRASGSPEEVPALSASLTDSLLAYLPPTIVQTLQSGSQVGKIEGEHRKVSIIFINLLGINELLAERGPGILVNELQSYLSLVVQLAEQYGGFIVDNDIYTKGLKLILVFGAPVAHEQDAANSLRLALELNRELLGLDVHFGHRIGINSGFVFAGDIGSPYRRQYTVMGDAVNLSARLMSSAAPGQILLSQQVAMEAGPSFALQKLAPIPVKGKKEPVSVFALEAERALPPVEPAEQLGAIFGREAEIESFQRLCSEVEERKSRTVVISGEAGIGKSRLSIEFQNYLLGRNWVLHYGRCYSHTAAKPFAPWIHVLNSVFNITSADAAETRTEKVLTSIEQLGPILLDTASLLNPLLGLSIPQNDVVRFLDDETRRRRLFELILKLLQAMAEGAPLTILLEDLHYADHSSLQLVNHIGTNQNSSPLLMCLTHRPKSDMELNLPPATTVTFDLRELSRDAAQQIIQNAVGETELPDQVAEAILSKSRGNPLFLEEVARSIHDSGALDQLLKAPSSRLAKEVASVEIPDRIQALFMSRIDTLDTATKEVVRAAAVIGQTFNFTTLQALLDFYPEDIPLEARLQELIRFDLISRTEDIQEPVYQFKHALIQEVSYSSLLFARRRQLHHRVASYLEEAQGKNLEPAYEALVHHYHLSSDRPKTRLYSVKAAEKARQVFAHEEAIEYYQLGLNSVLGKDAAQSGERSYFMERIGDSYESSGHHLEAARIYSQALRQWARAFRQPAVLTVAPPGFDDTQPPKVRQAALQHKVAVSHERNSDYDSALKHLELAFNDLPPRQPRQATKIVVTRSLALFRKGLYEDAIYWGRLGLSLSRRTGDRHNLAYAYNILATSYLDTGSIGRAIRYRQSAISLYEELGNLPGQAEANNNLGACYQSLGVQDKALHHFEIALALSERIGNFANVAIAHNNVGEVLLILGRTDEAISHLQKVVETYQKEGEPLACCGLALINLSRGYQHQTDYTNAFDCSKRGMKLLRKAGARGLMVDALFQESELLLATSQVSSALSACRRALGEARDLGLKLPEARGLRILGCITMIQDDRAQAEVNLRQSIALARQLKADYEKGLSLLCLAKLYASYGKEKNYRQRYRFAQRQATAIFRRIGAQLDLSQALALE